MSGRECYHCKQWVDEGESHDCWTTTEGGADPGSVRGSAGGVERLREAAASLGDQRIYASHKSIMFSRKSCYLFVRPKRNFLEACLFLGRTLKAAQIRRSDRTSKTKVAHLLQIRHRDEVEAPITEWLQEAYDLSGAQAAKATPTRAKRKPKKKDGAVKVLKRR